MINQIISDLRLLRRVIGRTLAGAAAGRTPRGAIAQQMYQIGNRSLLFVCVTLGFIGMVLVFQTCLQVNRITGDLSQVGGEFIKILVHEFGPSLTAMMLATRVGAGIAAEVGSMVVTEQIDALRMNNVDPVDYLIVPRFIASLLMTGVLAVIGVAVALGMGALTAFYSFHLNPVVFFDPSRVRAGDLVTGLVKCVAYGAAIPVVAGFCGLTARGGSEGVGAATTRAVISSSFVVIVLDFIISGIALFTWQGGGG
jgi:phospholipid/cholesterol/gamma-HCH transport system permease protein